MCCFFGFVSIHVRFVDLIRFVWHQGRGWGVRLTRTQRPGNAQEPIPEFHTHEGIQNQMLWLNKLCCLCQNEMFSACDIVQLPTEEENHNACHNNLKSFLLFKSLGTTPQLIHAAGVTEDHDGRRKHLDHYFINQCDSSVQESTACWPNLG